MPQPWAALLVFGLTWLLIAGRRWAFLPLGRPAGAMVGAVAMVATGSLSPEAAYAAVDLGTLLLLFSMMALGLLVADEAALDALGARLVTLAGGRPMALLGLVSLSSGALSAVLVNDTVCVFFTPVVVRLCLRLGLPLAPYLIALGTAANLGSALTTVGNPQNMLIASLSGISFLDFGLRMAPAVAAAALGQGLLLWALYRKVLPDRVSADPAPPSTAPDASGGIAVLAMVGAFAAGLDLAWSAAAAAAGLLLWRRRDPEPLLAKVDWPLLLFFAGLFVGVAGLRATGLVDAAFAAVAPHLDLRSLSGQLWLVGAVVLGSNLVSNVPLVLLLGEPLAALGEPTLAWTELAFLSTVAGNLTLMGSVANLIVAERARAHHELGFFEFLRVGLPTTALSLLLGVPALLWADGWLSGSGT